MPLAIAINWMTLIGLVCACIETQKSHTNTQMYQSPNIYTKEPYKHQPMHLYTYKGKPHQYPQRLRMCQYFSTYTQQSSIYTRKDPSHVNASLYVHKRNQSTLKETHHMVSLGTAYSIWIFISSLSNLNRWSSSLGLFYHVQLKRDQGDWDWRLRINDTPNAIGCIDRFLLRICRNALTCWEAFSQQKPINTQRDPPRACTPNCWQFSHTTIWARTAPTAHRCHIWMSHVTYERVMSHVNESCHIWTSHVTYRWRRDDSFIFICDMNEWCVWMSHVTCERDMSHVSETCHTRTSHVTHMNESSYTWMSSVTYERVTWHIWTCHVTCEWEMSHTNESCDRYERDMSHMNESCDIFTRHVTYELVMWHIRTSPRAYERVMSNMNKVVSRAKDPCHTCMNYVTREWVKSYMKESCHTRTRHRNACE